MTFRLDLVPGVWTDLYAVTGLQVGTALSVQNLSSGKVSVEEVGPQPTGNAGAVLGPAFTSLSIAMVDLNAAGAWARAEGISAEISVGAV